MDSGFVESPGRLTQRGCEPQPKEQEADSEALKILVKITRNSTCAAQSNRHTCHIRLQVAGILCLLLASTSAFADGEQVTIEGGNEDGGPFYQWRVTNRHTSPIVRIEFPHFGADSFEQPPGWETGTASEMHLVGTKREPGGANLCYAFPNRNNPGLPRGASANFTMRIAPGKPALPSKGTVHIVFADETTYDVANVELPTMVDKGSPLGTLLGIAGLFVACIIILEIRKRRAVRSSDDDQTMPQP